MISVVIPAHDEALVLDACLSQLLQGAEEDEVEVVVVANGCHDDTAEVARRHGDQVVVVETPEPGKPHALELGDCRATGFPRVYVDADVAIDIHALRRLAEVLRSGEVHLAAPRLEVDRTGSSRLVRAYYRVWLALPWAVDEPVGSGVYGLSEIGHERLGGFHPDGADDWWVQRHIRPPERRCLTDVSFTVPASRTMAEVVRRKARILAAMQLVERDLPPDARARDGLLAQAAALLRRRPALAPHLVVFAAASVLARGQARRMLRRGAVDWAGDARRPPSSPPLTSKARP